MNAKNHSSPQGLAHQQIVELADGNADALICISGTLWVTAFGDSADILLHAGERLSLRNRTRVVVQALGPASYRVVLHARYAGLLQWAHSRYAAWLTQHPALR